MVIYTKEDLLSLLNFLEENSGNFTLFGGKTFRPLIRSIMYNQTEPDSIIIKCIEDADKESYSFLTNIAYEDLPLHINNVRLYMLLKWRLSRGI